MKRTASFIIGIALTACAASAPAPATPEVELEDDAASGPRGAGERALAEGRHADAIRLLREALAADPGDARAKLHLALAHDLGGEGAEAERLLRELVAERPAMARAWSNLGSVLLDRGADDEAMTCFERALLEDPKLAEAHFGRGLVLEDRGDEGALDAYRAAARLDPENPLARLRLGLVLEGRGARDDALVELRRAVSLASDERAVLAVAAGALLRLGQASDAARAFERARELGDGASLAGEHLLALVAAKEYATAAAVADDALSKFSDDLAIRYLRGVVHLRMNEADAARAIFGALAAQKDDPAIADRAKRALATMR
jgi:tetratricopeptide (TPR) repeat protein